MDATFEESVTVLFTMMLGLFDRDLCACFLALLLSLDSHSLPFTTLVHAVVFSARQESCALVGTLGGF